MNKLIIFLASAVLAGNLYAADPDADNTGNNERDRKENAITSTDQSNSPEAIEMVAKIRKLVVADENLSANAKNVKIIITEEGPVYLRGVVNSDAEKKAVATHAKQAGAMNIKNELTIKTES